ncbi:TPA: LamG domain-containing protein, partial [Candidatus Woesearchaeota archaeon]|nr:LamG domain-containing protein [Candidatus Woesearchaeota archaeon]
ELYLKDGNITFRYDAFNLSVRPTAISAGVWYHAIATYNETNQSLYLNSVLQVTG